MKEMEIEYITPLVVEVVNRDTKAPHLSPFADKRKLDRDFIIKVNGTTIVVPKGFITDGSSIPKVFHIWKHPFSTESFWAAVVHDYFYSQHCCKYTKKWVDHLFKEMIKRDGGGRVTSSLFHFAVRLNVFGGNF